MRFHFQKRSFLAPASPRIYSGIARSLGRWSAFFEVNRNSHQVSSWNCSDGLGNFDREINQSINLFERLFATCHMPQAPALLSTWDMLCCGVFPAQDSLWGQLRLINAVPENSVRCSCSIYRQPFNFCRPDAAKLAIAS